MRKLNTAAKFVGPLALVLAMLGSACLRGAELNLRLQYPMQVNEVVLTGLEGNELAFRPAGRDKGGRAYLAVDDLKRQRAVLNFLFPQEFYDAIENSEAAQPAVALAVLRKYGEPLLEYSALASLPGNMLPSIEAYVAALRSNGRYDEAVRASMRLPLARVRPSALAWVGALNVELAENGQTELSERLYRYILEQGDCSDAHLDQLMALADQWRERADYLKAFQVYRVVQLRESPVQIKARLWVAYCSFYLGQDIVPVVFLETLPEMTPESAGYPLRELIVARMSLKQGDHATAMRSAALGKTYSDVGDPWYPETLFLVGQLYAEHGMNDAAIAVHRELAIMFPESEWAGKLPEFTEQTQL